PGRWYTGPKGIATAAAVAGAAVWFAAGGLERPLFSSRATRGPSPVDDGIAIHARAMPLDYENQDPLNVQKWLQGKVDFGVRVPAFQNAAAVQGVRLSSIR